MTIADGFGVPGSAGRPPATIRIASVLLILGAAVTLLWAAVEIAATVGLGDRIEADPDTYRLDPQSDTQLEFQILATVVGLAVLATVFALLAVLLARALARGSRSGLWLAIGLCFTQGAIALLGYAVGGWQQRFLDVSTGTSDYSVDFEWITAHLPGWYGPYTLVHNVASLAVYGIAGILLVLPASVDHFAHRQPGAGGNGFEVPR